MNGKPYLLIRKANRSTYSRWCIAMTLAVNLTVAANSQAEVNTASVHAQSGDVSDHGAVIWGRCNDERDARLIAHLSNSPSADEPHTGQRVAGPLAGNATDYTGSIPVTGLKSNQRYYYRIECRNDSEPDGAGPKSPLGTFRTAPDPNTHRPIRFVWIADVGGQGWGRNPELGILDVENERITGGYVIFKVIGKLDPDFAVFAGDMIYADNPIPAEKSVPGGAGAGTWNNNPSKDFTALTLDDYRANWKYNLGDAKYRRFLSRTPIYVQWDDHEVTNNWYPGEVLSFPPYHGMATNELAGRSRQALFEFNPILGKEIFRKFRYGRHLELFLLDERSYRGANPENANPAGIDMLGEHQLAWLEDGLRKSTATWKIISSHDPLSIVTGATNDWDAWGQGSPEVRGREIELGRLLRFIRNEAIKNVVFITADVHFAAAISYNPELAEFKDFLPFWEFAVGPSHAGAFGPGRLDTSFGPAYEFIRAPGLEGLAQNLPPPVMQSFGSMEIDQIGQLTVKIHDITGAVIYRKMITVTDY
uniref:Alkaline phosphatase D n=1 Tax=Candidatus Kentrum sp. LFY TaxID=2126342 RepID=A0A450WPZ1_9GAMM|nr:MAG: alkaline phosphatase D [Candidatus Kentron sp. LFY]